MDNGQRRGWTDNTQNSFMVRLLIFVRNGKLNRILNRIVEEKTLRNNLKNERTWSFCNLDIVQVEHLFFCLFSPFYQNSMENKVFISVFGYFVVFQMNS